MLWITCFTIKSIICQTQPIYLSLQAGDVASFYSQWKDTRLRMEHYINAEEQGYIAGANMTGYWIPCNMEPNFWVRLGDSLEMEVMFATNNIICRSKPFYTSYMRMNAVCQDHSANSGQRGVAKIVQGFKWLQKCTKKIFIFFEKINSTKNKSKISQYFTSTINRSSVKSRQRMSIFFILSMESIWWKKETVTKNYLGKNSMY